MTTPTALADQLAQLHRLAADIASYGDLHQDAAQDTGDDDTEEAWFWVATTGRRLTHHLDQLTEHLAKLGLASQTRNLE